MKRLILAAALCAASPVHAQTALEFAAAGMGVSKVSTSNAKLPINRRFARRVARSESMLAGVYGPLADKAREIEAACGSRVISGRRHTRVAGTRRWSLHAQGKAVDITGNSPCIYAHLRDWPGGVSIDYHRVHPPHVHVSYDPQGGREMGVRFVHRGGARRVRYAHR